MNGLALCSGIGCLDLGLRIATAGSYRVVCHVEWEAFPASTLVARMEEKALDQAPVWDDITTFDGRPWHGVVDIVTAGLPCQPYSLAGERKAHDDERALWPEFVRIVEEVEPAIVFLENIANFLRFYGPVWSELSRLGFIHAPPLLYTAHEVGAIHERKRLFVLATHPDRLRRNQRQQNIQTGQPIAARHHTETANRNRPRSQRYRQNSGQASVTGANQSPTDSNSNGLTFEWSGWLFDIKRQTLRHDIDRCGDGCRICGSIWETESPPVRVDHGPANRLVELRAVGNGVVPDVAAAAWTLLMSDYDVLE